MEFAEHCLHAAGTYATIYRLGTPPMYYAAGADAQRYLHGRVTQDIKSLQPGTGARSLVLTPQGRILGHFMILREAERFFVVSDPLSTVEARDNFAHALLQFKVADDVVLTPETGLVSLAVIGPQTDGLLRSLGASDLPKTQLTHLRQKISDADVLIVRHQRGQFDGCDLYCPAESAAQILKALDAMHSPPAVGDADDFETLRIMSGTPRMEADLSEQTLAPEIDLTALASFHKGCYAGQEVVEMATARGRPNRKLMLFAAHAAAALPANTEILSGDQLCGVVTSSCALPSMGESFCLAIVKTAHAESESFRTAENVQLEPLLAAV